MSKRNPLFLVSRNILRKRFRFYSTRSKNEFDEAIKKWGSMPRYLVEFNERYKRPYGIPGWVHILLIVAPFFIVLPLYQTYLITNQRKYGHRKLSILFSNIQQLI